MLMALRRLSARRGPLKAFYSDNATNFFGANNIAVEDLRTAQRKLGEQAAKELELCWRFIPVYSPWVGGAWERLIGYIKRCLMFCLAGETPSDAILSNVMIEAELLTNRRPLTHSPIDPDDEEPVTPNLALFGAADAPQVMCAEHDTNKFARLGRKRVAHLLEKYRRRWESEYLPVIANADRNPKNQRRVKVGDVVLVAEGEIDRNKWKLGRIIHIHPTFRESST